MSRPFTTAFCTAIVLCTAAPLAAAAPPVTVPTGDVSFAVKAVGDSFDKACAAKKGVRFVFAGTDIVAKQAKKMPDPLKKLIMAVWHQLYQYPDPCTAVARAEMAKFTAQQYAPKKLTIDGYYVAHKAECDQAAWTIVAGLKELLTKI